MKQTVVLVIIDGWGIGEHDQSNPIYAANPQSIIEIEKWFPSGALQASGIAVGLPWEEEGNSEVGHLTMGAGKTLYQHFPRISLAIQDGSFFSNEALKGAWKHVQKNKSSLHFVGLITQGNVHAASTHISALIEIAKQEGYKQVYFQLFADGRDSPPQSIRSLLTSLQEELDRAGIGTIASVTGRYYAMNRDGHWDRTEKTYLALTAPDESVSRDIAAVSKKTYEKNLTDEFMDPTIVGEPHPIGSNDAIIFFNFREDGIRQIAESFLNPSFDKFERVPLDNLYVATMTSYHESFTQAHVAFPPDKVLTPLGKVVSDAGKSQLRIAETQKYAHVTYFFNGLRDDPFPNEYRILIPSDTTLTPEKNPEMQARTITDRVLAALGSGEFDFIVVNYPNPDVIAHTGNFDATVAAVKVIDKEIERLTQSVLASDHIALITSDHGNAERVLNPVTGEPETKHNTSPVPCYLVGNKYKRVAPRGERERLTTVGLLADVAPTILSLLNIKKPAEMTGESVLDMLS